MRVTKMGPLFALGPIVLAAALPIRVKPIGQERYSFRALDTFTDTECRGTVRIDYTAEFSALFKR